MYIFSEIRNWYVALFFPGLTCLDRLALSVVVGCFPKNSREREFITVV